MNRKFILSIFVLMLIFALIYSSDANADVESNGTRSVTNAIVVIGQSLVTGRIHITSNQYQHLAIDNESTKFKLKSKQ